VIALRHPGIRQVGACPVANIKEITQHAHGIALLAVAEQFAHRHAEMLAEQVEQRGFDGGNDVVHAQVDLVRLRQHPRLRIRHHPMHDRLMRRRTTRERLAQAVEHGVVAPDRLPDHKLA